MADNWGRRIIVQHEIEPLACELRRWAERSRAGLRAVRGSKCASGPGGHGLLGNLIWGDVIFGGRDHVGGAASFEAYRSSPTATITTTALMERTGRPREDRALPPTWMLGLRARGASRGKQASPRLLMGGSRVVRPLTCPAFCARETRLALKLPFAAS